MVYALVALGLIAVVGVLAGQQGARDAETSLGERGLVTSALYVSSLRAELDKHAAVPFLVARDADVRAALIAPEAGAFEALSAKLETLSAGVGVSVIYIVDARGLAVAASNYRGPTSFVGNDYAFRAYFQEAMANRQGQLFALGSVSNKPGLYLAERIEGPSGPIGVVVAKVEFDAVEAGWASAGDLAYVSDARGVVLLTDVEGWRFNTLGPINDATAASLRESLQFGAAPLTPLPVTPAALVGAIMAVTAQVPGSVETQYLRVLQPVTGEDWTLQLLLPLSAARAEAVNATRALWLLVLLPLLVIGGVGLRVWQRGARRQAEAAQQRLALEAGIAERTQDLRASIAEREVAAAREARLREELAQSNRLAVLGQIAAGVAHEINQPVGAIRAYADNGAVLIERQAIAEAQGNFGAIVRLTERIGAITEQLRGFARKDRAAIGAVDLGEAVESALALLGARVREQGVDVRLEQPEARVAVAADRLGLEQIIVNLVQNGLEAMAGVDWPVLALAVRSEGEQVVLSVRDNGAGISPEIYAGLFTPFSTSKPRGLGLGLVISQDLAASFGGSLVALPPDGGGAVFVLTLRRA